MKVKNYMEDIVDKLLPELLKKKPEICNCEHCISDIKALALNNLPPKYIATEKGEVYSRISELSIQFETDVTRAILQAMEKVNQFPRH